MRIKWKWAFIGVVLISSCRAGQGGIKEIKDKQLTIQVQKLETQSSGGVVSVQIRLWPQKDAIYTMNKDSKEGLWYRMDSCFYLKAGDKKMYPAFVQPVANGINGSYEYLVTFNYSASLKDGWQLIYKDKYLNMKTYELYNKL